MKEDKLEEEKAKYRLKKMGDLTVGIWLSS
jgi:hypothetical protein